MLKSDEAVANLGLFARPDGKPEAHMQQLRDRVKAWTGLVKNGKLPTRSVWTSYTHQLWPGLRYGFGASPATMTELSKGLDNSDYYLLSSLGVMRTIKKE